MIRPAALKLGELGAGVQEVRKVVDTRRAGHHSETWRAKRRQLLEVDCRNTKDLQAGKHCCCPCPVPATAAAAAAPLAFVGAALVFQLEGELDEGGEVSQCEEQFGETRPAGLCGQLEAEGREAGRVTEHREVEGRGARVGLEGGGSREEEPVDEVAVRVQGQAEEPPARPSHEGVHGRHHLRRLLIGVVAVHVEAQLGEVWAAGERHEDGGRHGALDGDGFKGGLVAQEEVNGFAADVGSAPHGERRQPLRVSEEAPLRMGPAVHHSAELLSDVVMHQLPGSLGGR